MPDIGPESDTLDDADNADAALQNVVASHFVHTDFPALRPSGRALPQMHRIVRLPCFLAEMLFRPAYLALPHDDP